MKVVQGPDVRPPANPTAPAMWKLAVRALKVGGFPADIHGKPTSIRPAVHKLLGKGNYRMTNIQNGVRVWRIAGEQ